MGSPQYLIYTAHTFSKGTRLGKDHATKNGIKTLCGKETCEVFKSYPFNLENVYACDKCRKAAARILEEYGKRL